MIARVTCEGNLPSPYNEGRESLAYRGHPWGHRGGSLEVVPLRL